VAIKKFHTGSVKKSVTINASKEKVWRKISNIVGLPTWLPDVKKTIYTSKKRRGVGAIRLITFEDGNQIEEHIVAWEDKKYFSYIATSGLPLRMYHATLSITPKGRKTILTWQNNINSKKMTKKEFDEFISYMAQFYITALKTLKTKLE